MLSGFLPEVSITFELTEVKTGRVNSISHIQQKRTCGTESSRSDVIAFDLDFAVAPEKCIAGLGRHLRKNKY